MKTLFVIVSVILVLFSNAFAIPEKDAIGSLTEESKETTITFEVKHLDSLKGEFLKEIYQEEENINKDQILDKIKNNEKILKYFEIKLDEIYDELANFVLSNPSIRKSFEYEGGEVDAKYLKNFFKSFATAEDIMDCLILSVVDVDFSSITTNADMGELIEKVYIEIEKILSEGNLEKFLSTICNEVLGEINTKNSDWLNDIIHSEVKNLVDANNLENSFENVYNKLIENVNNDDNLFR